MLLHHLTSDARFASPRRRGRIGCLIVVILLFTLVFGVLILDSFFVTGSGFSKKMRPTLPRLRRRRSWPMKLCSIPIPASLC